MKNLIPIILLLLLPLVWQTNAFAQVPDESDNPFGIIDLENEESGTQLFDESNEATSDSMQYYKKLCANLYHQLAETPDDLVTMANLAHFYAGANNPMRNLPMAMRYIQQVEDGYSDLVMKKQNRTLAKYNKRGLTLSTLRQLKESIIAGAHTHLASSNTLPESETAFYAQSFEKEPSVNVFAKGSRIHQSLLDAETQHTLDSYYSFVEQYGGTSEADSVELTISQMATALLNNVEDLHQVDSIANRYKKSPSVQRCAQQQRARIAFAIACTHHNEQEYRQFMKDYAWSEEYMSALERLEALLQQRYGALHRPQELADFIEQHTDNELADRAMEQLYKMIIEQHDVEAAKIYLKRFPLDPNYTTIFSLFYSWHAAEGNRQPIETFSDQYPEFPFMGALKDDLREAASIDSFPLNQPYSADMHEKYMAFVRAHESKKIVMVALQRMIQPYWNAKDWAKSVESIDAVLFSFLDKNVKEFDELHRLLNTQPDARTVRTMECQPAYNMLHPVLHPDGTRLFYNRKEGEKSTICMAMRSQGKKSTIWKSIGEIKFSNAENTNIILYSFSPDGTQMLVGRKGDICIATLHGNEWEIADPLPKPINTRYTEFDAYWIPDGSGILFASDRPEGHNMQRSQANFHGDNTFAADLYFAAHTDQGWGDVINLGPKINSEYCEHSPLISRNLKTLYFISDATNGLGYGDIYMCTRENIDDWTTWSTPVNLGREANSPFNESSISFANNEKEIYISSNSNNYRYGCYSIRSMHDVSNSTHPLNVDNKFISGANCQYILLDLCKGTDVQSTNASRLAPSYLLFTNRPYALLTKCDEKWGPSILVGNENTAYPKTYTLEQLINSKRAYELNTIAFESRSPHLQPISVEELDNLANFLKTNPESRIELGIEAAGGDAVTCFNLSQDCGRSIRRYLASQGVQPNRVCISGLGNANLKDANRSDVFVTVRFFNLNK